MESQITNEETLLSLAKNFYESINPEAKLNYEKKLLALKNKDNFYDIIFNILSIPTSDEKYNLYFIGLLKEEFGRFYKGLKTRLGNKYIYRIYIYSNFYIKSKIWIHVFLN